MEKGVEPQGVEMGTAGADDESLLEDYRQLCGDSEYRRWLLREIEGSIGQRVLEVGTGIGGWVKHLGHRQMLVSIDISEYRLGIAREACRDQNVVFQKVDICHPAALDLMPHRFDTVLCINTLEHIEDDRKALGNIFQLLQPGGKLVMVVPAIGFLYGSLDRRYGHHRRYRKDGLVRRMKAAGFEVESVRYRDLLGAVGWFVYGRLLRLSRTPTRSFALFDRMVPGYARIDRIIGPPLGLSIIAIGSKR